MKGFQRVQSAYRPKTTKSYCSYFTTFLRFYDVIGQQYGHITPVVVLSFIEYQIMNGLSHGSIVNYISGVKQSLKMYNLQTDAFDHDWIKMSLTNVSRTNVRGVFTLKQIEHIVAVTSGMTLEEIYVPVFLLALFGFLRLSNLVPPSISQFDSTRHVARGDILPSPTHGTLIIKWTKTLQRSQDFATIQIPVLKNSPLCPLYAALQKCFKTILPLQTPLCFLFPRVQILYPLLRAK